jgi:transposase
MLMLPPSVRIFAAVAPVDMRRGFDGLSALVRETLGADVAGGDLFVFRNRQGDKLKVIFASRQGLCLFAKRLEKGVFHFPESDGVALEIDSGQLAVLLEGLEVAARRAAVSRIRPGAALR